MPSDLLKNLSDHEWKLVTAMSDVMRPDVPSPEFGFLRITIPVKRDADGTPTTNWETPVVLDTSEGVTADALNGEIAEFCGGVYAIGLNLDVEVKKKKEYTVVLETDTRVETLFDDKADDKRLIVSGTILVRDPGQIRLVWDSKKKKEQYEILNGYIWVARVG